MFFYFLFFFLEKKTGGLTWVGRASSESLSYSKYTIDPTLKISFLEHVDACDSHFIARILQGLK